MCVRVCVCVNIKICIYHIILKKRINVLKIYLCNINIYILGWFWVGFDNIYTLSITYRVR